jgi:hypothetical protein
VHTNERKTVCVGTEQQTITLFTSGATSISSTPILLSAKDSFGNTSPTSIVSVAIDTIAESPPTLLAPESGEQITGPLVVRFQCASANQTIVTENPYILPNGKRVHQCTEVGETTISIDIWDQTSVLSSPLKLHSIDQNGNKSDQTTISIGLKGSAHPTPEILSPAAGSVHSDSIPFVVSCLAAGTSLNFSGSGIVSHTHVCSSAANYSVDLDLQPGTEDQASQVSMTSYDSFGFSSTKIVSLHLDNSAPALPEVLDNSQWINSTSSTPMVSWSSSSSDDISRYELAVGSSPGASDLVDWADVGLVLSSTLSTPQLDECSTYYASLRTVDNFGNTSEALASATGFVPDVSPPLQPSSLQLGLDSTPALSDTLVWQASADNCQLSHYDFAIGSTPASNDKLDWVSVEQALTHQAAGVFIGPQVNHSSVRAVDAAGNLSTVSSSEAWVVRPEAITTLAYAARTATSIEVAWTEPESYQYELVDYIIEYKKTNETDWSVLNDGVNTEINAMVTGLEPSTTYDLRVSASNGRDSEPSASIAEFTAPNSSFFDPESYQAFNLGGATDSTVVVYEDGTEVKLNGSTIANLNAGESFRFTSALNDEVEANNPFFLAGKSQAGTAVNYIANMVWNIPAWSGKSFSFTGTRDANHLVNIRAFEAATVNLYRDNSGTPFQSQVMAANTNHLFSVPNGSYKVESTGLITGYLYSSGGDGNRRVDSMPILPAATDLLGYPSRWGHLSSLVESNEFSLIESSSNSGTTGTLNPFSTYTVTAKGNPTSLYRSDAMRILSQDKMVARSNADADGWSSAPFMPRAFMRKKYALNVNADYVAFVSDKPAVIEFINPADGSVAHTITLSKTGTHPMAPYKGYTNTYDLQGYIYQSADKFGAWYQPNSNNGGGDQDETIMFGTDD